LHYEQHETLLEFQGFRSGVPEDIILVSKRH